MLLLDLASPPSTKSAVAALVSLFFPLFSPVGEAVYNWIARNRRLMMAGESCKTD